MPMIRSAVCGVRRTAVGMTAAVLLTAVLLTGCQGSTEAAGSYASGTVGSTGTSATGTTAGSTEASTEATSEATASSTTTTTAPTESTSVNIFGSWDHSQMTHNGNVDINDNVFLDALEYTGYNLQKHRADGMMWIYVLSKEKPPTGWLSDITYGGGSTGLETTPEGKPDIAHFERGGLVCASFATYVYFNYLPNVAGIDVSMLARPAIPTLADSWYQACQQWERDGLSRRIEFKASGRHMEWLRFCEAEEIPVGSILCFRDGNDGYEDSNVCTHVCIYAGYTENNHWVYHVGNQNGPEFCAVERMLLDRHPQMMLAIFTTPVDITRKNR